MAGTGIWTADAGSGAVVVLTCCCDIQLAARIWCGGGMACMAAVACDGGHEGRDVMLAGGSAAPESNGLGSIRLTSDELNIQKGVT